MFASYLKRTKYIFWIILRIDGTQMLKVSHTKRHTVKSLNTIITVWKDRACIFYKGKGSRVLSNFRMVNIELVDFIFKENPHYKR